MYFPVEIDERIRPRHVREGPRPSLQSAEVQQSQFTPNSRVRCKFILHAEERNVGAVGKLSETVRVEVKLVFLDVMEVPKDSIEFIQCGADCSTSHVPLSHLLFEPHALHAVQSVRIGLPTEEFRHVHRLFGSTNTEQVRTRFRIEIPEVETRTGDNLFATTSRVADQTQTRPSA